MIFLKLISGLFFFVLGWVYLYKPEIVLNLNRFAREKFFNDRIILLERKKMSVLFFCVSFIGLYMGFSSLNLLLETRANNTITIGNEEHIMYLAMQDYCSGRYELALEKYSRLAEMKPSNMEVQKYIAYTLVALGRESKAKPLLIRLTRYFPNDRKLKETLAGITDAKKH